MSDKFINIRLRNIIKNYNEEEKKFEIVSNYYRLAKCEEKDFQRNDFEKGYYTQYGTKRSQYCVQPGEPFLKIPDNENPEKAYLQGTRDSLLLKQSHAYLIFETWRCNDDTK